MKDQQVSQKFLSSVEVLKSKRLQQEKSVGKHLPNILFFRLFEFFFFFQPSNKVKDDEGKKKKKKKKKKHNKSGDKINFYTTGSRASQSLLSKQC